MTPEITQCRACSCRQLTEVLDLGQLAISDFLRAGEEPEYAPLEVVRCGNCTLAQLRHTVPRERLYRTYWYRSGTQEAMVAALADVAAHAQSLAPLTPGDRVLDIGSNDGTLLRLFPPWTIRIGFEPARNLYEAGSRGGNLICPGFWPPQGGERVGAIGLTEPKARVITSVACFYDAEDPGAFVEGVRAWLHPDGVWINQLAYLPETLRTNNLGDFCHEHLTYWTVHALERLLNERGLRIDELSFNEVNGGSIRVVARHASAPAPATTPRLPSDAVMEATWGRFRERLTELGMATRKLLTRLRALDKRVIGYGASTKGQTLLQYYGIGPELLPAVADRNPEKWGRRMVTGIPVISEAAMRMQRPDFLLILPHHFAYSFLERERALVEAGTRLIVLLPGLRTLGVEDLGLEVQPMERPA